MGFLLCMSENTHDDLILWSRSIYTANEAPLSQIEKFITFLKILLNQVSTFPLWALTPMQATGNVTEHL